MELDNSSQPHAPVADQGLPDGAGSKFPLYISTIVVIIIHSRNLERRHTSYDLPNVIVPAEYQLVAFVSHMGTSTHSGHYVTHVKKDGQWVIFNDAKVAVSGAPPRDMGYLYFFQRIIDSST